MRRSSGLAWALRTAVLSAMAWAIGSAANAQTNVMFIFDASGSMVTRAGADTRIAAAKKAMEITLKEMPKEARLGLLMYGHRRANDCTDIELVSPIGADDAAKISRIIQAVQPKGETPIAEALRQAARSFTVFKGQSNTIVLVTDGIEECKGDPCAAARELKASGLDLKVHIVGFTLSDAQRKAIQCVPDTTGGRYFEARDPGGLVRALEEVRQQTAQAAPAAPPPPPAAPARPNLLLQANGGQVIAAPSDLWLRTNDGKEDQVYWFDPGTEAIYAFKGEQAATFDTFTVLIPATADTNLKDFELLASDSLNGPYRSIGSFSAQNLKMLKSPYQEFKFDPVTAKYLKVRLINAANGKTEARTIQLYEFQLFGTMAQGTAPAAAPPSAAPARTNLLLQGNGGQVLASPDDLWLRTNDGKEDEIYWFVPGTEAIYAFKGEQAVTFDTFTVLIPATSPANLKDFELLASDSLNGPFRSIGTFSAQNLKLIRSPYQEFKFDPVTAKYLKVKLISAANGKTSDRSIKLYEFQVFGTAK